MFELPPFYPQFLFHVWLGMPVWVWLAWVWLACIATVVALLVFDLGVSSRSCSPRRE